MKTIRLGVLGRLLLLFLVVLAPLFSLSAWSVRQANQKLEQQITSSVLQSTERFARVVETQVAEVNKSALNILAQTRMAKLARVELADATYETYYNINVMREFMTNVRDMNPIVSNIRMYLPAMEAAYNANGYNRGSQQPLSQGEYEGLVAVKKNGKVLTLLGHRLISLQSLAAQTPRSLIEVEYNQAALSALLSSALIYPGSYYEFELDDRSFILTNLEPGMQAQAHADPLVDAGLEASSRQIRFQENTTQPHIAFRVPLITMRGAYTLYVPLNQIMQPSLLSARYVYMLLLIMMLGLFLYFAGTFRMIHTPLQKLIEGFRLLGEDKQFGINVSHAESPDFAYLYTAFNKMSDELHQLINHEYSHRMLLQQATLRQLQAQINPHFLYNSFFMLHRMIKAGQHEESITVSKELGSYFQFITKSHSETVPLSDEYTHARIYCNIQTIRFGDRIQVRFGDLPDGTEALPVPKLILQPLVENAFNYGLENKVSDGLLAVQFQQFEDRIDVTVEENGEDLSEGQLAQIQLQLAASDSEPSGGEAGALYNIRKRLRIYYGREQVLDVSRSALGGMCVRVSLYPDQGKAEIPAAS